MSYTYHGTNGIIALPGRSISTFPSGLVRVDRTYAVRADRASAVRREFAAGNLLPFDDGTPAIDGLYIFPEPQETRRDDGFVEFKVSGYGRTGTGKYTRLTASEGALQIDGDLQWISRSATEFLIQEFCIVRVSALQKVEITPPAPVRVVGSQSVQRLIDGRFRFVQFFLREYWVVVNSSSIKFGIIEEVTLNWALVKTYGQEWKNKIEI
jgi:hypothetical protein